MSDVGLLSAHVVFCGALRVEDMLLQSALERGGVTGVKETADLLQECHIISRGDTDITFTKTQRQIHFRPR